MDLTWHGQGYPTVEFKVIQLHVLNVFHPINWLREHVLFLLIGVLIMDILEVKILEYVLFVQVDLHIGLANVEDHNALLWTFYAKHVLLIFTTILVFVFPVLKQVAVRTKMVCVWIATQDSI